MTCLGFYGDSKGQLHKSIASAMDTAFTPGLLFHSPTMPGAPYRVLRTYYPAAPRTS